MGGAERDVDVARFLDGLAAVHRFDDGELSCSFLEDSRDSEQVSGALRGGEVRPGLECFVCGLDGAVDIYFVGFGDLGELFLGRGVDGREMFLAVGLDHLAADEKAVARLDLDVVDRFGGGRVLEDLLGELRALLLGDCHQSMVK